MVLPSLPGAQRGAVTTLRSHPGVRPELNRREEGLSSLHLKCQAWDLRDGQLNIKLLREKKSQKGRKKGLLATG